MSVNQVLRKLGQWSVQLVPDAPPGILNGLEYFGHVAIIPGRLDPVERGDELLTLARYVGVLRSVETVDQPTLAGPGMAMWLGDEDGKGDVFETPGVTLTAVTFAAAVRALLPPHGAITEGTFYSGVAGTITSTHAYQTPRTAIDYVCDTMGGTWRVNGNGTLDAGPAASLFRTLPTCVVVRKGAGYDATLRALPGSLDTLRDAKDYTSRVILIAAALAGGTADAGSVPYKDIHGNTAHITRIIDEQADTLIATAPARAAAALATFNGIRRSVRLDVDEFDVAGDFEPGDTVWVYDPDAGLSDTSNEVTFRGRIINPVPVSVLSLTWPVEAGHTVAYRSSAGAWTDLTPWVDWESSGGGQLEVADSLSTPLTSSVGTTGTQVAGGGGGAGDSAVPDVPVFGAFTTSSYQPGDGLALASVTLTWTRPLNTDASTIVDGDHYEIRYRQTGQTAWQTAYVAFDQTSFTIVALRPSTGYDFQIRAVDYATPTNYGAWSATTAFTSAQDTTAPATPAPPTVAASLIAVQVTHTLGLASGGTYNLPLDMDHFEVHVGTSAGFTASTASLVGKLLANGAMVTGSIPAVGTYQVDTIVSAGATAYVRVVAVDKTGNRSTASSAASATASLIDDAHIGTLTVSKVTAGTMSAAIILGGSIKTGTSGSRVEQDSAGVRLYDSGGSLKVDLNATTGNATFTGSGTFSGALSAATGTFAGSLSAASGTFAGSLSAVSGSFGTVTGGTFQTASSGARVVISSGSADRISFFSASGDFGNVHTSNTGGTDEIGVYSGSGSSFLLANSFSCSLNGTHGVVSASSSGWTAQTSGGSATASVTATSGALDLKADSSIAIGGGGFSETVTVGDVNTTLGLGAQTINLSNITGTAASTALTMVGRALHFVTSTRRNKVDIRDAEIPTADVLRLRPVTYQDRGEVEAAGSMDGVRRNLGMVAEEVADIPSLDSLLVVYGDDGLPISLGYDRLPVAQQVVLVDHESRMAALERRFAVLDAASTGDRSSLGRGGRG